MLQLLLVVIVIRLLIYIWNIFNKKQFDVALIDIVKNEEFYIYTYFLSIGKKYYKLTFISHIPHIWWTEIQTMLKNIDIYSNIRQSINLPFGKLKIEFFNRLDLLKYKYFKNIDELLDTAVKKQITFMDDYNQIYGHPDLSSLHKN